MDEPTRGLGYDEVPRFLALVDRVLDEGRSVIAIEHNLAVITAADWIIELGPGSGHEGGQVVATGVAADIIDARTITGRALADLKYSPRARISGQACSAELGGADLTNWVSGLVSSWHA
ncbi:MAG: hypothetical protein IPK24_24085 [Kineosporiaceae bacterium]|nr:hypothetical protein [Kineosporiaceae bacterium]